MWGPGGNSTQEKGPWKKTAIIASQGNLDTAYPPFILGSTGAASNMEVCIFFTFYGLPLLKKKIDAQIAPHANPAMPMKMPFGPKGFQNINWPMPNLLTSNVPGFQSMATSMMKQTFKNKGVASLEELREACIDMGVKMIGCQMTMDVFGFSRDEFIEEVDVGGAAMFLEYAAGADIQLFM